MHRPGHGHRRGRPAVNQPDRLHLLRHEFEFEFEFVGKRIELEFDNEQHFDYDHQFVVEFESAGLA